ncbi:hypothetical protein ALP75_202814 [Pseudomonas syringae pv. actinidiae]|nr:hypothetical protein ALP75_202814 [Pseudomonas syringae pv. actinidiae]
MPGDLPGINAQPDRRVVQPRAVEVQREAFFQGQLARGGQVLKWQHLALHGVFQGQQTCAGKVEVVRLDGVEHLLQAQRTVRLHVQRLRLNRAQYRRAAPFVFIGVGLLTDDVFIATLTVRHQRQQIAHGAGWHEQGGVKPETLGERGLEQIDRRVFTVDIIAQRRMCHGVKHACGRQSHCVAAQIDDRHEKAP